jgi:hypothetical protein
MNKLCTDAGYVSLNKAGEELCGDHVEMAGREDKLTVVVLADGLGSGVKACILSTLTSKILSTMMAASLSVEDCVNTVAAALPLCKERNLAYSTFTIIRVINNTEVELIQYDNPQVILLREGKNFEYPRTAEIIDNKTIYKTRLALEEEDTFIALSDGAIHAGPGPVLNLRWQREEIIRFMEEQYSPDFTAKTLSSILLNQCAALYGGGAGDDATVCTVKIRQRRPVNLLIGPPAAPAEGPKMMSLFFSKEGKHIICGGTTSKLASEFLKKPLEAARRSADPEIPPTAQIAGVDLVTEGVITIHKVLEYAQDYVKNNEDYTRWSSGEDGASRIARLLFEEATDINFFVGRAVNPAHQNPELPIGFNIKMRLIDDLASCLKIMGKRIRVSYF